MQESDGHSWIGIHWLSILLLLFTIPTTGQRKLSGPTQGFRI
jgi:hypothetical protein